MLTRPQPRSASSRTATSPTGPARVPSQSCPARVASPRGASSVAATSTRGPMQAARPVARDLATSRTTARSVTLVTGLARALSRLLRLLLSPPARAGETLAGVRDVDLMLALALPARSSRKELLLSVPPPLPTRTASGATTCVPILPRPQPALMHQLPLLLKSPRHPKSARD
jgi:hypothetical protein